jgi:hypothetical protein
MTDGAADQRSGNGVMACDVAANSADRTAAQAPRSKTGGGNNECCEQERFYGLHVFAPLRLEVPMTGNIRSRFETQILTQVDVQLGC